MIWNGSVKETETAQEESRLKKKAIRKEVRLLRAGCSDEEIHAMSLKVLAHVLETEEYREAETLFVYVDCKHETETSDLIRRAWADGSLWRSPGCLDRK